jgi:mono/diheme cytochrome c family protein
MLARLVVFVVIVCLAAVPISGCGSNQVKLSEDEVYPIRTDWLVKSVPNSSGSPTKWYDPGYPPLFMLNRPLDTLTGDDALLANQVRGQVILDTRKVETDVRDALGKVLTDLFGTPAEPKVPDGSMLISATKLDEKVVQARESAAGNLKELEEKLADMRDYASALKLDPPTLKEGGVVFRNYCQQCHGLTGDGNGPGARYLIPMPRDYREGLFKFITTDPALGNKRKPRRDDLHRTIAKGLDGSPMPQFGALSQQEIEAVISYVIHLSIRGEAEFEALKKALDERGDGLSKEEVPKEIIKVAGETAALWADSARRPIEPETNPYMTEEQIDKSAENGYRLFASPEVGCTTCHTNYGRSSPFQFDSWGTIVRPRNLTVATLRGGRTPDAIYARIYGGILGSNMPAHTHLKASEDDKARGVNKLWDLVHFVQYVSESEKRQVLKDKFQIEFDP